MDSERPFGTFRLSNRVEVMLAIVVAALFIGCAYMFTSIHMNAAVPAGSVPSVTQVYQEYDNNDLTDALTTVNSILATDPNSIQALLAKADVLEQIGSLDFQETQYGQQAIQVAQQVLTIDPNNSDAYRLIGYAYEIMQQYPQAHTAYQEAITLDPTNALAVAGDAHVYDLEGNMTQAKPEYEAALKLDPTSTEAEEGLARADVYAGDLSDALTLYTQIANTPGNAEERADAAYSAGQVDESMGDYTDAQTFFTSSTTLDPTYAPGWTGLASEIFRQAVATSTTLSGDERSALAQQSMSDLQKAINLDPNESLASFDLAGELAAVGQTQSAIVILKALQGGIVENDITLSADSKTAMMQKVTTALDALTASSSIQ